jgi:uncharacterized membrane protein YdjX (TVP38/TMEM64 family)
MSTPTETQAPPARRVRRLRLIVFAAVVLALFIGSFFLPVGDWVEEFYRWVKGQGVAGAVWYGVVYVVCTVLFVPGTPLSLGAGALYGPFWGTVLVSIASTIGAGLAFLVGRYIARAQVHAWVAGNPKFAALDTAIARRGWWIVFLLRLSPVFPFNLLNYALGLTGVRFTSYLLASWVGMLPGTIAYILVGYAGQQTLSGSQKVVYWIVAAVATLVVTFFITRVATRAIRSATNPP